MMSEEKVLKKLDIADFRHLTKDKVIKMASMLDKMDPEVAKKALEQFPEFANTTKEMLTEYKVSLDKGLESNILMSAEEPQCNAAIQRMVPPINLEQIKGFIDEVPYITELQKTFYKRFEQILKPAYDMVMSENRFSYLLQMECW